MCVSVKEPGQCQGRRQTAGTEVRFQDKDLRAVRLWDWHTGGVTAGTHTMRWVPRTAALWAVSASKIHGLILVPQLVLVFWKVLESSGRGA